MQAALVLLAVAGSTAWLAVDASKRDWTDNSFGRNAASWVIGSLLLWPLIFPMYVFVHRKKAPLKAAPEAKPEPAAAMVGSGPSELYGPSVDDVEIEPEPIEPEPFVYVEPEPEPGPVVEFEPEPFVEVTPTPAPAFEPAPTPEPNPVAEFEPVVEAGQPVVETMEPMIESAEPVAEVEVSEPAPEPEPKPMLKISHHPELPTEEAPPGLSVDAFKDIKPVAFGGAVLNGDAAPVAEPTVEPEPEPEPEPAPEPVFDLSYPLDNDPGIELEIEHEMATMEETPVADEPVVEETKPKKRGFRLPNPELKLPSFGKKKQEQQAKPKRGLSLPQITLPENLQGQLSDLERKIVLGSVVAILAAGALGYSTAPADEAAPAPAPAPPAASR